MMVAFNQLEEGPCALATPLQPLGWEWDYKKIIFCRFLAGLQCLLVKRGGIPL